MSSQKYGEIPENEDAIARKVRRLDLSWYLRSPYIWGLVVALVTTIYVFVLPVFRDSWQSWSPGPLHAGHSILEKDCASCHTKSFTKVDDAACSACHKVSEHGTEINKINTAHNAEHLALKRCSDCHIEHQSQSAFIPKDTKLCAECHKDLGAVISKPSRDSFASFAQHTEFKVKLADKRVSLGDNPKDINTLKFNHSVHLKPDIRGANGDKVTLACGECHQFPHGSVAPQKITFEKNCRSCHELSFDDRLPNSKVPHGNVEEVFQFLIAEYAKLLKVDLPPKMDLDSLRAIPGKVEKSQISSKAAATLDDVFKEARASEALIFTKTSCQLCHLSERKQNPQAWSSNFSVTKPIIPDNWFSNAKFLHSAHEIASCESCHKGVKDSKDTADLLLPGVDNCRSCHVDSSQHGILSSNCSTCHEYHVAQGLEPNKKREIDDLLKVFK